MDKPDRWWIRPQVQAEARRKLERMAHSPAKNKLLRILPPSHRQDLRRYWTLTGPGPAARNLTPVEIRRIEDLYKDLEKLEE